MKGVQSSVGTCIGQGLLFLAFLYVIMLTGPRISLLCLSLNITTVFTNITVQCYLPSQTKIEIHQPSKGQENFIRRTDQIRPQDQCQ